MGFKSLLPQSDSRRIETNIRRKSFAGIEKKINEFLGVISKKTSQPRVYITKEISDVYLRYVEDIAPHSYVIKSKALGQSVRYDVDYLSLYALADAQGRNARHKKIYAFIAEYYADKINTEMRQKDRLEMLKREAKKK